MNTHRTDGAMFVIFLPPNTAKSTLLAVKWFSFEGHPDVALSTMILRKGYSTFFIHAFICGARLSSIALLTNNLFHSEPVHRPAS
mmetsp:Transcript_11530/g.17623  ORF Transcript_11530/g.17623 Transcript_11530/m.17623 type:complete len:85 (+) Transcript_11530:415-669(+)